MEASGSVGPRENHANQAGGAENVVEWPRDCGTRDMVDARVKVTRSAKHATGDGERSGGLRCRPPHFSRRLDNQVAHFNPAERLGVALLRLVTVFSVSSYLTLHSLDSDSFTRSSVMDDILVPL